MKVTAAPFAMMQTARYLDSPVVAIYASRQPIRRHLADPNCPDDFPILRDLRAEGATDYAAFPLVFFDGAIHVATWSTQQPGGFTSKQFSDLESVIAPLARVAEIRALRRTAENLLETYVGHQTGREDSRRQDPPRLCGSDPRRDLALGYARASPRSPSGCRRRS